MRFLIKRVYEGKEAKDGFRVLVDRLWPRGLSKEKAEVDLWFKEIAPSNGLRAWFKHDPAKWNEFRKRYEEELHANMETVKQFHAAVKGQKTVTLLYGAKDEEHNQAVVLREFLSR